MHYTGFEDIDRWYDKPLGRLYLKRSVEGLTKLIENLNLEREGYALDAGCGAGHYTLELAKIGWKTVGVDISDLLVRRATHIAKEKDAYNTHFVQGDISSLPFPSGFFSLVICFNVLEFIPDARPTLMELKRVLSPSGLLVLGVCNRKSVWGLFQRLQKPFRKGAFFKGNFFTHEEIGELVTDVGFRLVKTEGEIYFLPIPFVSLSLLLESVIKKYLGDFPGCLILSLS